MAVVNTVGGWVMEADVHRLMRHLAFLVGYVIDDLDWGAVQTGLELTDSESERWFDYPLVGERQLTVKLAKEPDAYPVMVQVSGDLDDVLAARIETLISVLSDGPDNG